MATREENIKKINDRLEQLSDAELEKVAGGKIDFDPAPWLNHGGDPAQNSQMLANPTRKIHNPLIR